MKQVLCVLTLGLCGWASADAAMVTLASLGMVADSDQTNTVGPTVVIPQHPGWAAPLAGSEWVSYGQTGNPSSPGYFMPTNGLVVSFFDSFFLPFVPSYGTLTVRADDSAALTVNGTLVLQEATFAGNTYSRCSDFPVGCTEATQVQVDLTPYLVEGVNTLRFDVSQRASISFGLNYAGYAQGEPTPDTPEIPEPATYLLVGGALIAVRLLRK